MSTDTKYIRTFVLAVIILASICSVLVIANLRQGLRLRLVDVNKTLVTEHSNQPLVLYLNRPINTIKKSQITITPQADFNVNTNGQAIILQLKERLRSDTNYTVRITNVQAEHSDHETSLNHNFHTTAASFYYLERTDHSSDNDKAVIKAKTNDVLIQRSVNSKDAKAIFKAPKIQEFVIVGDKLAVIVIEDKGNHSINKVLLMDRNGDNVQEVRTPQPGISTQLHASPRQGLIGFTFSDEDASIYDNTLLIVDLAAINKPYTLAGINGQPLKAANWRFAPDGTSILAQLFEGEWVLIDGNKKYKPRPLGELGDVGNFTLSGKHLISLDPVTNSPLLIDVLTGSKISLKPNQVGLKTLLPSEFMALNNSDAYVQRAVVLNEADEPTQEFISIEYKDNSRRLFGVNGQSHALTNMSSASNDQYLSVELSSKESEYEESYVGQERAKDVKTVIINARTGKTVHVIQGLGLRWP